MGKQVKNLYEPVAVRHIKSADLIGGHIPRQSIGKPRRTVCKRAESEYPCTDILSLKLREPAVKRK